MALTIQNINRPTGRNKAYIGNGRSIITVSAGFDTTEDNKRKAYLIIKDAQNRSANYALHGVSNIEVSHINKALDRLEREAPSISFTDEEAREILGYCKEKFSDDTDTEKDKPTALTMQSVKQPLGGSNAYVSNGHSMIVISVGHHTIEGDNWESFLHISDPEVFSDGYDLYGVSNITDSHIRAAFTQLKALQAQITFTGKEIGKITGFCKGKLSNEPDFPASESYFGI